MVFVLLIFSVSTTATGGLCRHAAAFPLSDDNPITRTRRINEYPGKKNEESVGIIFALCRSNCENDWISGRQKPGATRMRTERLKKTVGLYVYQITKTKIYN